MMRRAWLIPLALAAALIWPVVTSPIRTTTAQEPPPAPEAGGPDADGAEVLTRGPIHEAFAEPITEPEPTLIVPKQPPEDIEEVPPEYAPEGEDAIWINGYWAWDDEREEFIWISGVHRVPPPGMRWVAGYWAEADSGWQWNRGFWTSTEAEELSYREPPPESLEEGPSSPSPGDDYFYVPGNWSYYETDYRWTPGYWSIHRPNWCWVPARWVWTPRGCIYLNGYWDWMFARRGLCYAPVYFHRPIYARPGYFYRPWCGLNVGNLFVHFWVRPRYCHYYFGNYYGNYDRWGLRPWHTFHGRRGFYDPLLTFNVVHFRTRGINYVDRIGGWHRYYDRHADERPPITFADQRRLASRVNITNITEINKVTNVSVKQNFLTADVRDLARLENNPMRLRRLTQEQQQRATERARQFSQETVDVRRQRREIERVARADAPERGPDLDGKGAKGKEGTAGGKGKSKGKADGVAGTKGRVAEGARLKLPESRVAVQRPRVQVPERPDRGRPGGGQARGGAEGRGKGPDRSDRTPDGQKGDRPDRVARPDGSDQPGADRGKGKGKGKGDDRPEIDRPGADRPGADRPGADRPGVDRPGVDRPGPRVDRGGETPRPGPRVERPERGRPERGPGAGDRPSGAKGKGETRRSYERPDIDTPRPEPRVERPEPRVERPAPRIERPEPRIERPEPRVERPGPRVERPAPRIERPEPRVERPAPRVERPAPRPSSRPASSSSRESSRGKGRDRD